MILKLLTDGQKAEDQNKSEQFHVYLLKILKEI